MRETDIGLLGTAIGLHRFKIMLRKCFWAVLDVISFAYHRVMIALVLMTLVFFFLFMREKVLSYLELSYEMSLTRCRM